MTLAWSHELAMLRQSPFWRGLDGSKRWQAFLRVAERYEGYNDLPKRWQAVYQEAKRALEPRDAQVEEAQS